MLHHLVSTLAFAAAASSKHTRELDDIDFWRLQDEADSGLNQAEDDDDDSALDGEDRAELSLEDGDWQDSVVDAGTESADVDDESVAIGIEEVDATLDDDSSREAEEIDGNEPDEDVDADEEEALDEDADLEANIGVLAGSVEATDDAFDDLPFNDAVNDQKSLLAVAKKEKKPAMVILSRHVCIHCHELAQAMSEDKAMPDLMKKFVSVHVRGDAADDWGDEMYVPRVYFYDASGKKLEVHSPSKKYPYFFWKSGMLADAMKKVLNKTRGHSVANSSHNKKQTKLKQI